MWNTATLKSKDLMDTGVILLSVEFGQDNAPEVLVKQFNVSSPAQDAAWLKTVLVNELTRLNGITAVGKALTLGTLDVTPESPKVPPQSDLDRDKFFQDYIRLTKFKQLVTFGVLTGNEKEVVDLEALVIAEYKPEYFG